MKTINKILLALFLLSALALAFPRQVQAAAGSPDDKVVFGGTFTLSEGETLDGNLAVFGGTANIEEGARVNGDLFLMGGTVNVNGRVDGDISTMGGSIFLGEEAIIHGDLSTLGGALHQADGALIQGQTVHGSDGPFNFDLPNRFFSPRFDIDPFWRFSSFLAQTLAMAALAVLIVLAAPNATGRVAQAVVVQPILASGLGLLTILLAPVVILLLLITILLIPVGLILILLLAGAAVFGYIALGLEFGRRLEVLLKGSWSPALSAGIGTLALGLIVGLIGQIPCIGWLLGFGVGIAGLGGVLLTRFGTQLYPPAGALPVSPAPYPPAPVSPVSPVYPAAPASPIVPAEPEPYTTGVDIFPAPDETTLPPADEDPYRPV